MQTKSPKRSRSPMLNSAMTEEGYKITPELIKIIHSYVIGPFDKLEKFNDSQANLDCINFHSFGNVDMSMHALAIEFKKFIAAIIIENLTEIASPFNSDVFVPFNYIASPYINRIWRFALSHPESFQGFCMAIFRSFTTKAQIGPFMVGPNNFHLFDDDEVFDKYNESIRLLERHYGSVDHMFWPKYADYATLGIHFRSFVWINNEGEAQLLEHFRSKSIGSVKDVKQIVEEFQRSVRSKRENIQASEPLLRLISINSQKKLDNFVNPSELNKLESLFDETLHNTPIPNDIIVTLSEEQLISVSDARRWILEYKKFIFMLLLAKIPIVPSFQVEQVWRLHMSYAESYKKFLHKNRRFNFALNVSNDERVKLGPLYDNTIDFYSALFGGG